MNKTLHYIYLSLVFISTTILMTACGSKGASGPEPKIDPAFSSYISAFSYGRISTSSPIQIELTQDLASVELNKPIEDALFSVSPSIKGKAYWTSTRNIQFVPDEGELKPGTKYDVTFKLGKVINVDSHFKEFKFRVSTPDQAFRVDLLPYSPTKDNDVTWNSVKGSLTLADNVSIDNIKKMLSLSGANKEATIKVTPTEDAGNYSIIIDSLLRKEKNDVTYTLNVKGSPIKAKTEDLELKIEIPAINSEFKIIDVRATYEPKKCIRVTFSDPLSASQSIQGLMNLSASNYSFDKQGNVLKVYLNNQAEDISSVIINLHKEIQNHNGNRMQSDASHSVNFYNTKPNVEFVKSSGNILPNAESLVVPIQATNLWAVDIRVIKIYQSNILAYLQVNDLGNNRELKRYGRLELKKRVRLDIDPTINLRESNTFNLDLSSMIEKDPGAIYQIELRMNKDYSLYPCGDNQAARPQDAALERFENLTDDDTAAWDASDSEGYYYYYEGDVDWSDYNWQDRDNPCTSSFYTNKVKSCIVLASNIGMTAKQGKDKTLFVALTDILTTKPISGATVDVYNLQMQRIGSGKTDGDGFVNISYKGGAPYVIVATNGNEKGYLKVAPNLSLSLSNFDVSGKEIQKGLKGYIYGERGVWRPGDSIYVTFILEDKNKTLPKNHPVSLELFTPRGQLYKNYTCTEGVEGFYPFRMATLEDDITGDWRAKVSVGGATFFKTLKIETVKPNRLKIRFDAGDVVDASARTISGSLTSQWLHGAAASNLKATVEMRLNAISTPFKGYEQYAFNDPTSNFYTDTYTIFNGNLNSDGYASVNAPLPQAASAPGLLQATFISRVFETGGDASIFTQSAPYSPYSTYVGIKTNNENDYDWLETDSPIDVNIATLGADGKPKNSSSIRVKVYKLNWSWWWSRSHDDLASYINSTSAEVVFNEETSTRNGKGKVSFQIDYPSWGRYLIMAHDNEGGHTTGRIVYVDWPSWRGRSNKQDAGGATMLSFSTDKNSYEVGDKATVILPKSSDGRALITIEDGTRILSKTWVNTSANDDTKHTFTITEEMAPNFYVGASLIQPHAQTENESPLRMYGVINVSVNNKMTKLEPVISMPNDLRPEKEFSVSVSEKNKQNMTYTLAIVDDGLLDLTAFKTPNPWPEFYARQSLGIRTWDMFDLVIGAHAGKFAPLLSIGGGDEMENKMVSGQEKKSVNRFKPVVKFIGPFTLSGGKTNTHKIQLPQYIGSVRTMIVAGNAKGAYGSAEKTVQVKNPLMILTTLPRVAGPGEEILLPVNVFAMDSKVKSVNVSVKSQGLFEFTDGTSKTVTFSETGDKMVYFKVKVANKIGAEKVTISASGGGETASESIEIAIRNPNPAAILIKDALVSSGESASLDLTMDNIQSDDWAKLEISRIPGLNLNKHLEFFFNYPHGCSEQVTSAAFPQLYIGKLIPIEGKLKDKADYHIKEAIKIIGARQLSDGGIAYWPGDRYPTEWVTTYAGHFLVEAKRAGYQVPKSVLDKWITYQKNSAKYWDSQRGNKTYYTYQMNDLQQAYRLYTLALAESPDLSSMNRLKETKDLSVQARWRLAAAYMLSGKKDAANQLVNNVTDQIDSYSFNNDTYGSSTRDIAMIMETYLLMGKTSNALKLSHQVARDLSGRSYLSTQSAAYALIAMSKLGEKMGKGPISYTLKVNGKTVNAPTSSTAIHNIDIKPTDKINVEFQNKGEGDVFVRLSARTKPIEDKTPAASEGMNIYVTYTDLDGRNINVNSLKQGTEFYANVVIQNISGQYITDLALNHIFASGWEIFNERLFDQGANTNSSLNYQDIRDDRVLSYFNVRGGYSRTVKVRLQAAYCGRFYLPAVSCEAMYNPDIHCRTTGQWVEVVQ